MQKQAKDLQVDDVIYIKKCCTVHKRITKIRKTSTSGGCRVTIWVDGYDVFAGSWLTLRGSTKVQVIKTVN